MKTPGQICIKLTIKTTKQSHSSVFIYDFEHACSWWVGSTYKSISTQDKNNRTTKICNALPKLTKRYN